MNVESTLPITLYRVCALVLAAICGCTNHSGKVASDEEPVVPPIQELASSLSDYAADSRTHERVKQLLDFVNERKNEQLGDSKPVEVSRVTNGGRTVIQAVWERTFKLAPDPVPAPDGIVPVVARSGEAETHLLLGIKKGDELEASADFQTLCSALQDSAKMDSVSLIQSGANGFEPAAPLVQVYKLLSVEEKPEIEVAEDGQSVIIRACTFPVDLTFVVESGKLKIVECDFAKR